MRLLVVVHVYHSPTIKIEPMGSYEFVGMLEDDSDLYLNDLLIELKERAIERFAIREKLGLNCCAVIHQVVVLPS